MHSISMKNFESVVFGRGYNSQIRTPNILGPRGSSFLMETLCLRIILVISEHL